jgi:hypothetical protein
MRRARGIGCLVLCTVLLHAVRAEAAKTSISLKLGGYFQRFNDPGESDPSFSYGLAFGYHFNRNIAAQLGVDYFTVGLPTVVFTTLVENPAASYYFTAGVRASVWAGGVELYGLAGIGTYVGFLATLDEDETGVALAAQVGGGISFWIVGLEARYAGATPRFQDEDISVDSLFVSLCGKFAAW